MVELQGAEKSIFAIIDTIHYHPSAPWTDYTISLTRHNYCATY